MDLNFLKKCIDPLLRKRYVFIERFFFISYLSKKKQQGKKTNKCFTHFLVLVFIRSGVKNATPIFLLKKEILKNKETADL